MTANLFGLTDQEVGWLQSGELNQLSDETMARLRRDYPDEFADFSAMAPLLARHAHLTGDEVNAYLNGNVAELETVYIEAHLQRCDLCTTVMEASREFFFQPEPAPLTNYREATVFLALNNEVSMTQMRGSSVKLRGNTPEPLVFEKDDITVFLELEVHAQARILRGQLLLDMLIDDESVGSVEIWQAGFLVQSVNLDEMGMFECDMSTSGIIDIRITLEGHPDIALEQIVIAETG